jgi:hypothetical protein
VARDEQHLRLGLAEAVAIAIVDLDAWDPGAVALGADVQPVAFLISRLRPT